MNEICGWKKPTVAAYLLIKTMQNYTDFVVNVEVFFFVLPSAYEM